MAEKKNYVKIKWVVLFLAVAVLANGYDIFSAIRVEDMGAIRKEMKAVCDRVEGVEVVVKEIGKTDHSQDLLILEISTNLKNIDSKLDRIEQSINGR